MVMLTGFKLRMFLGLGNAMARMVVLSADIGEGEREW